MGSFSSFAQLCTDQPQLVSNIILYYYLFYPPFGFLGLLIVMHFVSVSPEIHSWERTVEVSAGDDLTIICDATGNPPPKITWRKQQDGKVLP